MISNGLFGVEERDFGKLQDRESMDLIVEKDGDKPKKDKRFTKHVLKLFTITTHSCATSKHHIEQEPTKLI
jgi:hypothetical protein